MGLRKLGGGFFGKSVMVVLGGIGLEKCGFGMIRREFPK